MKDYVSYLWSSMSKSNNNSAKSELKSESKKTVPSKKTVIKEDYHISTVEELLKNLDELKVDFEKKILIPARQMGMCPQTTDVIDDTTNPHLSAIFAIEDAILNLKSQLEIQHQDPNVQVEVEESINEDDLEDNAEVEDEIAPEEPIVIDEWEYMAQDPEFNYNATLLYDKGKFVTFIQKDSDPENKIPYYVNALGEAGENLEHEFVTIDDACAWLQLNELPVPTEDAKMAISGSTESLSEAKETEEKKDFCKKLPDGMKRVEDDLSTTTLAPLVEDPEVTDIKEPKQK